MPVPRSVSRRRLWPLWLLFPLVTAVPVQASEYEFTWSHPRPQGNALGGASFEDDATGYAVGDRGSVVKTTDGGVSWGLVEHQPPFSTDLRDVLVVGPGELLAVGAPPGIFRSNDGGASWSPVPNPSSAVLNDIERVSGPNLATVGDAGQVLTSADGGETWVLRGPFGSDAFEQFWWSPTEGYVAGQSRVRRTTDGGATWLPLNGIPDQPGFFRISEVFFTDALNGYVLGDFQFWKTTDGGTNWTSGSFPGLVVYVGDTIALTPLHLIAVSNLEGAAVYETTDGENWHVLFFSGAGAFLDLDRLGDGTLLAFASEGDVFRSTDDGVTWTNQIDAAGTGRRTVGGICAWPGGRGAAGSSGTPGTAWYESTDGGASFHADPSGPTIAFTQEIDYWDADHAVVAGDYGRMWRTTNGGADWSDVSLPSPPSNGAAWHLSLPAPGVAFASVTGQSQCLCYRTTDYGASWHSRSGGLPTNGGWTGISFVDAGHGFLAGYNSSGTNRLWKTTDGGGQWTAITASGLPASWLWDMHWHDLQTGLVTSSNLPGGIYRTTDAGSTWTAVWAAPARDLDFHDGLYGVAGTDAYFAEGRVLVTEDGGVTWQELVTPAASAGTGVAALPDGFLVGGDHGVVMKATRVSDPTAVGDGGVRPHDGGSREPLLRASVPAGSRLRISFELPEDGPAELSIHDVEGRRVATLRRGRFEAGRAIEVEWDGSRDDGAGRRSGVYFARLTSGTMAKAVKLVYVR